MKVEVNADRPLRDGFWWENSKSRENWASIKYERLSYFCYGCGMLGHMIQICKGKVQISEGKRTPIIWSMAK